MLARLENEDMLAPAYFATKATENTSMIWSSLIARHPHKSLLELQPELRTNNQNSKNMQMRKPGQLPMNDTFQIDPLPSC